MSILDEMAEIGKESKITSKPLSLLEQIRDVPAEPNSATARARCRCRCPQPPGGFSRGGTGRRPSRRPPLRRRRVAPGDLLPVFDESLTQIERADIIEELAWF